MKKRYISFLLAILMMFLSIGENKITSFASSSAVEEITSKENVFEEEEKEFLQEEFSETDVLEDEERKVEYHQEFLQGIVPEISVKEAYDKYLMLELSVPQEAEFPKDKTYYYEVKVILKKEKKVSEKIFLFEKEEENSQTVLMEMQEGFMEEGEQWSYTTEVRIVSEENDTEISTMEEVREESQVSVLSTIMAEPYYESNLTLKKKKTTIYTTQEKAAVAQVKFSKKTTVRDNIKVEDLTYQKEDDRYLALEFSEVGEDGILYADAKENTALGKHIIEVTADAAEGMYASRTTMEVTVVQGIEEEMLDLEVPSYCFYKEDGKNVTFNAKAIYRNDIETLKAAKTKKVTWEILSAKKEKLTSDHPLYGYIKIKNGKVTIDKNYMVSEKKEENSFVIKLCAADFEGNDTCVYSDTIEITKKIIQAGEAAIVKFDEEGNGYITAESNSTITSDLLGKIVVFKKEAPQQTVYSKNELDLYTVSANSLAYKSSNSSIKIEKDGTTKALKPVKNASITVSFKDNSKQKAVLKNLTVCYDSPAKIGLKIEEMDDSGTLSQVGDIEFTDKEYFIGSITDKRIKVTVMKKDSETDEWTEADSLLNYKLTIPEGTGVKKSGEYQQYCDFVVNKKSISIKLNDKSNKKTVTYTITNQGYVSGKSPKLSLKGSLKAASYEKSQEIIYTLKKNGNFEYDPYKKYVFISANSLDKFKNERNIENYTNLEAAMGGFGYREISNGKITLNFESDTETPLVAGKYQLWFVFGKLNESGAFVADTGMVPVTITVKKVELPKGNYKLSTKYNLSVKEGGILSFKGSGKNYLKDSVEFLELKNANVKGSPNSFTDFFEIRDNKLVVKHDLTEEQLTYIQSSAAKNNLYGYVSYSVSLGNTDGSYYQKTDTAKVSLTMKESVKKYTIDNMKTTNTKSGLVTNVKADGKPANILYAWVTKGNYTIEADGSSVVKLTPKTGKDEPVAGANKLTVFVVVEGTFEPFRRNLEALKTEWDNAVKELENLSKGESEEKEKAIEKAKEKVTNAEQEFLHAVKQYGIKINTTVELPTKEIENTEYVKKVVELVNQRRKEKGLKSLQMDNDVNYAAYIRAKEIVKTFSHTRPDGTSCFTVLKDYGITYYTAGENIAMGYATPEAVVEGWMNSEGHRANILGSGYTHIGVGVCENNGYYYWVQLFIGR